MKKIKQAFSIAGYNFRLWRGNPRIVVTFALSFILCFLLTDKAVRFAVEHNTTLQLVETFIWSFGDSNSILLSSVLLVMLFADMPFLSSGTPFYLVRTDRRTWITGQVIYIIAATSIYMVFVLVSTILLSMYYAFPANMWSPTAAILGYTNAGKRVAIPALVKTLEMSWPYQSMISIFTLMLGYHLKCGTYGKKGKEYCTPHQIRQDDLYQVVLDDLRRVTHFARKKEKQFAAYITRKNSQELRKEITGLQKEVDTMERRIVELTSLFKRLYEDNVLGRITNEQFRMLSADYNAEQKTLEEALPEKKARLEKLKASASNVDAFIEKAKRFTTIDELTPELLRLFIQRIEIGERAKKHAHSSPQKIRIVYKDIGIIDSEMEKGEQPVHMVTPPDENTDMQLLA